jgi:hypothetical protein
MVSLDVNKNRAAAKDALQALKGGDLKELCGMFELSAGISRSDRISRLLALGEKSYTRLVRLSRLVSFGYCAENYVSAREMKDILTDSGLYASGSKHEMFMDAVTRDRSPAAPTLATMDITGIRKTYKCILGKPPIESESGLRDEILQWLDFKPFLKAVEAALPKTYPGRELPTALLQIDQPIIVPPIPLSDGAPDIRNSTSTQYDVAISYASEDEKTAEEIAEAMKEAGLRVFFAPYARAQLWGEKLGDYFKKTYGSDASYVLLLVSKHYFSKDFPNYEFTIALGEARRRKEVFILPVRLDSTPIIGLLSDIHYIEYSKEGPDEIARFVKQKVSAKTPIIPQLTPRKLQWPSLSKENRRV